MIFWQCSVNCRMRQCGRILWHGLYGLSAGLLICALVFPLSTATVPEDAWAKDLSAPFPCQHRPCGCRSAEQCWKQCCCYSNAQKVAWARAHGVTVPDFVLTAASDELRKPTRLNAPAVSGKRGSSTACARCAKAGVQPQPMACGINSPWTGNGCLKDGRSSAAPAATPADIDRPVRTAKHVLAAFAAECQGFAHVLCCVAGFILPLTQTLASPGAAGLESLSLESERLGLATRQPPLPPPKLASVPAHRLLLPGGR